MGDQDLNISFTELKNNLSYMELKEFHEILEHAKLFQIDQDYLQHYCGKY